MLTCCTDVHDVFLYSTRILYRYMKQCAIRPMYNAHENNEQQIMAKTCVGTISFESKCVIVISRVAPETKFMTQFQCVLLSILEFMEDSTTFKIQDMTQPQSLC